jgi:hypothetical protein
MAGRRRTHGARAADGSVRPSAGESRAQEVKTKMLARYAEARDPHGRLVVGFDYVRSAAAGARRTDPVRTEHLLEELVRRLLRTGDELLQITARGGRR